MPIRIPVAVIPYTQTVPPQSNLTFTEQLWLQLLDWPLIALFVLLLLLAIFRKELAALLARGGITLVWGDKSFTISDLPEELDESFSEMVEEIEDLRNRLSALEDATGKKPAPAEARSGLTEAQEEAVRQRMISDGLEKSRYRWRSIERLAAIGGVTEADALAILRSDRGVRLGTGKSGRQIARLKER